MNPMYKKMLLGFLEHLERRDSANGWQIISRPSYDNKTNYVKSPSKTPPESQRKTMRIFMEWFELGMKERSFEVDSYLRVWDEEYGI